MSKSFEVRDFAHFEELCQELGFKKIPPDEARRRLQQAAKKPRQPQEGREIGFEFTTKGLIVTVWTTYLEDKNEFRGKGTDAGWVLITQNNKAVHFSRPARRTKNFLLNLYRRVWKNWYRILERPSCPECGRFMEITRDRRHLKGRYWSCNQKELHKSGEKHTRGFNFALLLIPKVRKFIEKERKGRRRYNVRRKQDGKQLYAAMLKRKKWVATGLENQQEK